MSFGPLRPAAVTATSCIIEGKTPSELPIVLGHEPAGIVEAVGAGVTTVAPDDYYVIACVSRYCGTYKFCTGGVPISAARHGEKRINGNPQLALRDAKGETVGYLGGLSSFAEKMLVSECAAVKTRDDMPLDRACLVGCGVMTGIGAALDTVHLRAGDTVVVIGCGGVGLSTIQGARIGGAGRIIAVDAQPWKFDLGRTCGATDCVDASQGNSLEAVLDLTSDGDYVSECIGLMTMAARAVQMTGRGGTTVFQYDMPRYVDFCMDDRLHLDEMISARIPLEQVNDAMDALRNGEVAWQVIVFD